MPPTVTLERFIEGLRLLAPYLLHDDMHRSLDAGDTGCIWLLLANNKEVPSDVARQLVERGFDPWDRDHWLFNTNPNR